jgi:hypothetical protein
MEHNGSISKVKRSAAKNITQKVHVPRYFFAFIGYFVK